MNENVQNTPGFSGDGESLSEVPMLGVPFKPFVQSDLSKPILITGRLKAKTLKWFPGLSEKTQVYLWSKFSDPSWNPNDYLKFESDDIELLFIISSCGMLYPTSDMKNNEYIDAQSWKAVDEEFRSHSDEDDCDDDVNFQEAPMVLNEITSEISLAQDEVDTIKVCEVLAYFKRQCCQRHKNCPKQHYVLGMGKLTLSKNTYEGIHIYVEPDYNEDQVDVVSYHDTLYQKYGDKEKELSIQEQQDIVSTYLRCLEETVDEAFDAPFPVGKREFTRK